MEESFNAYLEDHLTGDEEEKTVLRPGSTAKPKQELETGDKGQPLLPANCLTRHGDSAHFLNYQKQVLRSYVERMYSTCSKFILTNILNDFTDLAAKRSSGHVPWHDVSARQAEFIDQLEYMPIWKGGTSRGSSSAPSKSRASTAAPGESSDEGGVDGEFILLRDPSKMQKHEIGACFTHWLKRQNNKKIGFEFANVLNSRDGTLRPAVRVQELSDLGDTDSDTPVPTPRNPPKRKKYKKRPKKKSKLAEDSTDNENESAPKAKNKRAVIKTKANAPAGAGELPPHLPDNLLPMGWDPVLDPALARFHMKPGQYLRQPTAAVPAMMGPTGDANGDPTTGAIPFNIADATHAGYLAEMERGGPLMNGPVPAWMQQTVIHTSADPPLRPAIRYGYHVPKQLMSNAGIPVSTEQVNGEAIPSDNSSGSDAPDSSRRWMKTRSRSRRRNTDQSSMEEQNPPAKKPVTAGKVNRKRASSNAEGSQRGRQLKKSKSTTDPGSRPLPRKKAKGDTTEAGDKDSFDLSRRRVA
jgi:hypothetical protein